MKLIDMFRSAINKEIGKIRTTGFICRFMRKAEPRISMKR